MHYVGLDSCIAHGLFLINYLTFSLVVLRLDLSITEILGKVLDE